MTIMQIFHPRARALPENIHNGMSQKQSTLCNPQNNFFWWNKQKKLFCDKQKSTSWNFLYTQLHTHRVGNTCCTSETVSKLRRKKMFLLFPFRFYSILCLHKFFSVCFVSDSVQCMCGLCTRHTPIHLHICVLLSWKNKRFFSLLFC